MNCPVDGSVLTMSERSGVEIDYCPQCRGVWLDRGELDKIIERADREDDDDDRYARDRSRAKRYDDDDDDHREGGGLFGRRKKKKESFLSELFEFGG
jgi:Zn-finger nucleic acid-binding protein